MGYILASEFFRNLLWNGFKPDRHIQGRLDRWIPSGRAAVSHESERLQELIGRRSSQFRAYLSYSLVGIAAPPGDVPYSRVDNLIWLLGAYVERTGSESSMSYM